MGCAELAGRAAQAVPAGQQTCPPPVGGLTTRPQWSLHMRCIALCCVALCWCLHVVVVHAEQSRCQRAGIRRGGTIRAAAWSAGVPAACQPQHHLPHGRLSLRSAAASCLLLGRGRAATAGPPLSWSVPSSSASCCPQPKASAAALLLPLSCAAARTAAVAAACAPALNPSLCIKPGKERQSAQRHP